MQPPCTFLRWFKESHGCGSKRLACGVRKAALGTCRQVKPDKEVERLARKFKLDDPVASRFTELIHRRKKDGEIDRMHKDGHTPAGLPPDLPCSAVSVLLNLRMSRGSCLTPVPVFHVEARPPHYLLVARLPLSSNVEWSFLA